LFYLFGFSVLTQTIHALVALLYPFNWQHVYIPLLPPDMLEVCAAPLPFIVGVMQAHLPRVMALELEDVSTFFPLFFSKYIFSAYMMSKEPSAQHVFENNNYKKGSWPVGLMQLQSSGTVCQTS
jgi:hypothetical protein